MELIIIFLPANMSESKQNPDLLVYQMSVDAAVDVDAAPSDGVALSTVVVELWLPALGLNAVGSQALMLSTALLRTPLQPMRSSRVSAESRWRTVVNPSLRSCEKG